MSEIVASSARLPPTALDYLHDTYLFECQSAVILACDELSDGINKNPNQQNPPPRGTLVGPHMSKLFEPVLVEMVGEDRLSSAKMGVGAAVADQRLVNTPLDKFTRVC